MSCRAVATLCCIASLASCRFDTRLPAGVIITCASDSDCLTGQHCDVAQQRCSLPGAALLESATVSPTRGGRGSSFVLDVTVGAELLQAPSAYVTDGTTRIGELALTGSEGRTYHYRFTPTPGEPDGVYVVLLDARAPDGREYVGVRAGTFELDLTAPTVRAARLSHTPSLSNGLALLGGAHRATAATFDTLVQLQLFADSPLGAATLRALRPDGGTGFDLPLDPLAENSTDSAAFAYTLERSFPYGEPGAWRLVAHLTDDLGNAAARPLSLPLEIDTVPPAAASVDLPGTALFHRAPWGAPSLDAGPSWWLDFASDAGDAIAVVAFAGPLALGSSERTDGGVYPTLPLALATDLPTVDVLCVDAAGNLSPRAAVRDVEWVVGHAALGASGAPLSAYRRPLAEPSTPGLTFDREELGLDGSTPLTANTSGTWRSVVGLGPNIGNYALDDAPWLGGVLMVGTTSVAPIAPVSSVWNGAAWIPGGVSTSSGGPLGSAVPTMATDVALQQLWLYGRTVNGCPYPELWNTTDAGGWVMSTTPFSQLFSPSLASRADGGVCAAGIPIGAGCPSLGPTAGLYCKDGPSWSTLMTPPIQGATLQAVRLLPWTGSGGDFVWVQHELPLVGVGFRTRLFTGEPTSWSGPLQPSTATPPSAFWVDPDRRELYAYAPPRVFRWNAASLDAGQRTPTLSTESTSALGQPTGADPWAFDRARHRAVTTELASAGMPRTTWELDVQGSRPAVVLELSLAGLLPGSVVQQATLRTSISGRGELTGSTIDGAFITLRAADGGYRLGEWPDGGFVLAPLGAPEWVEVSSTRVPAGQLSWAVAPRGYNGLGPLAQVRVYSAELTVRYRLP